MRYSALFFVLFFHAPLLLGMEKDLTPSTQAIFPDLSFPFDDRIDEQGKRIDGLDKKQNYFERSVLSVVSDFSQKIKKLEDQNESLKEALRELYSLMKIEQNRFADNQHFLNSSFKALENSVALSDSARLENELSALKGAVFSFLINKSNGDEQQVLIEKQIEALQDQVDTRKRNREQKDGTSSNKKQRKNDMEIKIYTSIFS